MNLDESARRAVLLLIDVEPDLRQPRGGEDGWRGTAKALSYLEAFRRQIEEGTGKSVEFNWFLRADPQIQKSWGKIEWVAERFPELIKTIEDRRDHCGVHPHMWRWSPRRQKWFNDLADSSWTAECLQTSIEAFRKIFGRYPVACRFGDRWLNPVAVELMRASGIRYDLTVEPGLPDEPLFDDPYATGGLPDYRRAPREPWRPSKEDFLAPDPEEDGAGSIWLVPLSTTAPVWRLMRRRPYLVKASRSPNLSLRSSSLWPHLQRQLDLTAGVPLVMVVRTGDFERPYFLKNFVLTTQKLSRHPALARCEFTNPAKAVARWQTCR
jgi:hypothetical protein